MRRTLLLCSVCLLTLFSNAQNQTVATTTITEFSNPALNSQEIKIKEKENQITAATTSSRAQMNILNEELRALKEEYVKMLSSELEKTTDAQLRIELQEEISRYSAPTNTQTR